MTDAASSGLVLYDHLSSSFCQQVRIALREKGLDFKSIIPSGLGTGNGTDPNWKAANVREQVPTLVDGETKVIDSTIILEYLEDKFGRSLLPATPAERAKARAIEDIVQTVYESINWGYAEIVWGKRATGELAEHLKTQVREQTAAVHQWLTEQLGSKPYFNGDSFGWADIAVAPMMRRSIFYGDGLAPAKGSPLDQWHERICQRESVRQTFAEMEKGAKAMAESYTTVFAPGKGNRREYRDHRLEFLVKSGGMQVVLDGLKDDTIRFGWPQASPHKS